MRVLDTWYAPIFYNSMISTTGNSCIVISEKENLIRSTHNEIYHNGTKSGQRHCRIPKGLNFQEKIVLVSTIFSCF